MIVYEHAHSDTYHHILYLPESVEGTFYLWSRWLSWSQSIEYPTTHSPNQCDDETVKVHQGLHGTGTAHIFRAMQAPPNHGRSGRDDMLSLHLLTKWIPVIKFDSSHSQILRRWLSSFDLFWPLESQELTASEPDEELSSPPLLHGSMIQIQGLPPSTMAAPWAVRWPPLTLCLLVATNKDISQKHNPEYPSKLKLLGSWSSICRFILSLYIVLSIPVADRPTQQCHR